MSTTTENLLDLDSQLLEDEKAYQSVVEKAASGAKLDAEDRAAIFRAGKNTNVLRDDVWAR